MKLDNIRSVYDGERFCASVYIDVSRDNEDAERQIGLRWRAALGDLAEAGCDQPTLDSLEEFAAAADAEPSPDHGVAVFARAGAVLFAAGMPAPPRRPIARFAHLPHLMPLLAQAPPPLPQLLVRADLAGGEIASMDSNTQVTDQVRGSGWPVHRTSLGGWSQSRYQRAVDEAWRRNADDLADAVVSAAEKTHADIIVLAGDVRARSLLLDSLPAAVAELVVTVDADVSTGSDRLQSAAEEAGHRHRAQAAKHVLDDLRVGLARAEAVQGIGPTVAALRDGRVAQLLIDDHPTSQAKAWIGPELSELALAEPELRERGVRDPAEDRLDAALVRAVAGTDAELHLVPEGEDPPDEGLGATLRYADPAASTGHATSEGG